MIYLSFRNLLFQDLLLKMVSLALPGFPFRLLLHTDWGITKCNFLWDVIQFCSDSNRLEKTRTYHRKSSYIFLPFQSDFFRAVKPIS